MRKYVPRRCSERWLDDDCPKQVLFVMDNGGKTADRYTVMYTDVIGQPGHQRLWGRSMSAQPCHPQGIGMSFELSVHEVSAFRYRSKHTYATWSSLPDAVKRLVRADCKSIEAGEYHA